MGINISLWRKRTSPENEPKLFHSKEFEYPPDWSSLRQNYDKGLVWLLHGMITYAFPDGCQYDPGFDWEVRRKWRYDIQRADDKEYTKTWEYPDYVHQVENFEPIEKWIETLKEYDKEFDIERYEKFLKYAKEGCWIDDN